MTTLSGRLVAAVTLAVVAGMLAGCQQPQTPNEKQARLLAAENIQLKERLANQQTKLETQQRQQALKLQQEQWELSKCRARTEQLQKDLDKGIAERTRDVMAKVMDENVRLRQEVERLQAELKKSKAEPNRP